MTKIKTASIIIIGNEILSGRTKDTNTSTLATWLNSLGVKVNEVRTIPDEEDKIVTTLNILRKENDSFLHESLMRGVVSLHQFNI